MVVALPLLFLLLLGSSPTALVAADDEQEFTVLDMTLLKPHAACSGHRVTPPQNVSWVPLYHPLGSCSPAFRGGAAGSKATLSLAELLRLDRLRARYIQRMASGDFGVSKRFHKFAGDVQETQYHDKLAAISLNLGTQSSQQMQPRIGPAATDDGDGSSGSSPGVEQTVMLDTASDVPWVDCVPCALAECPYYDPSRSTTYHAFPCNSTPCNQLGRYANGCVNNQCQYRVSVNSTSGDTTSSGTYGSDLLTLNSDNAITGFKFGCNNNNNQNAGDSGSGNGNGIMALGRGAQSLTAQTSSIYGDAFSYCIPQRDGEKGFFRIGTPGAAPYRFIMTPMLADPRAPSLYRCALVGITVNGQPLNLPPETFAAAAVLDSRTAFTRLPLTAYGALRAAFRDRMAAYYYRRAPPQEDLDTCYNFTGVRYVRLPRVALVFDANKVVELDQYGIMTGGGSGDEGVVGCLAFAANDNDADPAILGIVQQKTIEVLHDVGGRNIGFRRQAC